MASTMTQCRLPKTHSLPLLLIAKWAELRSNARLATHECGEHAAVCEVELPGDTWREPWFFLAVSREADSVSVNPSLMRKAMDAANQRGCSRIIVHAPRQRGLLLGLLNQRRWWTVTRARLCAQHIIRERLGECGLAEHS